MMNRRITTILISLLIIAMVSLPVMAATYTPAQVLSTIQPYMKSAYAINPTSPMKQSQDMLGQVYIYKLPTNPVVYVFTSSGAIDCDGQATIHCTGTTDPLYQGQTSFTQSDGKPLNAELLPWYVLPETPNPIFDYANRDIHSGEAGVVLYNGKMEYGVFGDERGRDSDNSAGLAIGEVSYAMASALSINPDPKNGGIEKGVTYIVFTTTSNVVVPIESHSGAHTKGQSALDKMMIQLTPSSTQLTPSPNLVANPGFENGSTTPTSWYLVRMNSNTPTWSTMHHNGNKSIRIYVLGSISKISGEVVSYHIPSASGRTYNLSAWGKATGASGTNGPAVRLAEYNINHNWLRQNAMYFSKGTYSWTKKQKTFTTGANTAYIAVYANIYDGYGTFWIDDVSLTVAATTSTPTSTPTPTPLGDTIRVYRTATGTIEVLNIETQYLPYVIAAENDIAPYQSMKAQAIASRTFAYYKKAHPGDKSFDVYDDTRDQVYNPNLVLTTNIRNSVSETNGIVLKWGGVIICAFYISGSGSYAQYVTYNEGKTGDAITQSTLGWVANPPSLNPYNRGAMGQIQANALALNNGYTWSQILKYFYGADIIIETR